MSTHSHPNLARIWMHIAMCLSPVTFLVEILPLHGKRKRKGPAYHPNETLDDDLREGTLQGARP
uniref:Uncharacterized protein n=1 Tax=Coccidioides posadasii RMSCC 3488 TaxID=454284 RepID=A0A0J6FE52_COCPO|nr:hypothetical protein CPAG_03504 [Coccidioides posadasii RMSCC 3488]